jgi:hypothetical protein
MERLPEQDDRQGGQQAEAHADRGELTAAMQSHCEPSKRTKAARNLWR